VPALLERGTLLHQRTNLAVGCVVILVVTLETTDNQTESLIKKSLPW